MKSQYKLHGVNRRAWQVFFVLFACTWILLEKREKLDYFDQGSTFIIFFHHQLQISHRFLQLWYSECAKKSSSTIYHQRCSSLFVLEFIFWGKNRSLIPFKYVFQNVCELQEKIQKKMLILGIPLKELYINNPILISVLGPKSSIPLLLPSLHSA